MTSASGSHPKTVFRAAPTRFATAFLGIAVSSPASTPSLLGQTVAAQAIQAAPQKPSAAIPATLPDSPPSQRSDETPSLPPGHRLDVQFAEGKISVDASNASLNQVVREVADKAGIKVTGTVNDERVFGRYGPSAPSAVLATLLDGTGCNMLLVDDAKGASELVLTPRRGSPTPPNSNASQEAIAEEAEPASRYVPPIRPFQPPLQGGRPLGPGALPAQPEANQSGSDPNSARQIYDQLQRTPPQGSSQQQPPQ